MKYPCLILDHDDTVVNSTATVHYPAFVAFMKQYRPQIHLTLEEYFALNFDPGVIPLFRDICGLSEKEMREEENFWRSFVDTHIPPAYAGVKDILEAHRAQGGIICVVSHSFADYIRRDYAANHLPQPDAIYGWELSPELRKPSPYALYDIEKKFGLRPDELLVLDDLKPGYDMARTAGVSFAAAGWANDISQIETFMRQNCDFYFKTVSEFGEYVR